MLNELKDGLRSTINKMLKRSIVDERAIKEFVHDVQRTFLRSDVSVKLVLELSRRLERELKERKPPAGISLKEHAIYLLYEEIIKILGKEEANPPRPGRGQKLKILLIGLQGSGKTTAAAKLASYYKRLGYRSILIAADTYRPGAYDQLRQLAEVIDIPVLGGRRGEDAVKVVERSLEDPGARGVDVIIIDTAGRHKEEHALMEEMKEIAAVSRPDFVFLVLDATMGQQAERQVRAFHEATPIGGIIVTKLDSTAKGGGALTAAAATGAKIYFASYGEKREEFEAFSPQRFASRLLGLGDLKTLIENIERARIEESELTKRITRGRFTLEDFINQLEGIRKMGPLSRLLELLPGGLGLKIPEEALDSAEEKLTKWKAILQSMTDEERVDPDVLNSSRVKRIAKGAGADEREIRDMVKAYRQARKLARTLQKSRLRKTGAIGIGS